MQITKRLAVMLAVVEHRGRRVRIERPRRHACRGRGGGLGGRRDGRPGRHAGPGGNAGAATAGSTDTYPRDQTLYTTGTMWGPPSDASYNPLDPNPEMGTVGLVYETLFLYDPIADKFTPWLAESGTWTDANDVHDQDPLRCHSGVTAQPFTAQDVAFTIGLAKIKAVGSNIWNYVTDATATDDSTVVVKFNNPAYQQWAQWTYNSPILPKHIWESKANEDILKDKNPNGVGTGPYMYKTAAQDRMVYVKNDNWWGIAAGHPVAPKYIVDIVNGANNVALGELMQGGIDLSNNFLPGVATLVDKGYVKTYYSKAPYMLSANTAWLATNDLKKPMDDAAFRQAIAWSINVPDVVNKVYGNIVAAASPTGLLPTWDKYIDKAQVDKLGFKYDPAKAEVDPRRRRLQEGRRRVLRRTRTARRSS